MLWSSSTRWAEHSPCASFEASAAGMIGWKRKKIMRAQWEPRQPSAVSPMDKKRSLVAIALQWHESTNSFESNPKTHLVLVRINKRFVAMHPSMQHTAVPMAILHPYQKRPDPFQLVSQSIISFLLEHWPSSLLFCYYKNVPLLP